MNTLAELAVQYAKKQVEQVNVVTEANPIIASMPMKPASHGWKNVYAKQKTVKGPQVVNRDELLPIIGVSRELGETVLGKIGGRLPMPRDMARNMGGYEEMLRQNAQTILEKGSNANEKQIYYDAFLKAAVENGQYTKAGGTTANSQYSMVFVHYDPASTVGLFNPNALNDGKFFESYFLWGGAEGEIELEDGTRCNGKMYCTEMEFGVQTARPEYVGAIVNIEIGETNGEITGLPSLKTIAGRLSECRASAGNTYIYCHPYLAQLLAIKYKLSQKRYLDDKDTALKFALTDINGIPVIGSYNVNNGTEAVVA